MICEHILMITFSNEPKIFFHTQSNGSKNWYVTLTIHGGARDVMVIVVGK